MTMHHRFDTPSGRLHVADWGRGHPVVMIHGLFTSSASFDNLMVRLPEGRRGLAIDLPGFGESVSAKGFTPSWEGFARAVVDAADALELEKFDLLGHSMGGGIAVVVAALWPERVRRLVLMDAAVFPFDVPLKGRLPLIPVVGEALFRFYGEGMFLDYFAEDVFFDGARMDKEKVRAWFEVFRANRAHALAALRSTADPGTVARSVAKVRAATLVVWGERDAILPVQHASRLEAEIPGAALHIVPACGHAPIEEMPDATCPRIIDFLERGE
jgi:pimeloyl-ACP methyl ester carboxylesterase